MPLTIPTIDDRRYQDLLDETLARIPVHNPEWTNFNESDPGITLIELFAFLTENLLYRANQIPERNRRKFLSLLGVPLQPASPATGLVTFANDRGPRQTITLTTGLEVRAGQVPFRTTQGLDVLPVEAQVYYKRKLDDPELVGHYRQLYATLLEPPTGDVSLYETVPLWSPGSRGIDLGSETVVDSSLWIAVLLRAADRPYDDAVKELVRAAIGGRILNLGVAPWLGEAVAPERLAPGGRAPEDQPLLQYEMPKLPASGGLGANRRPDYQRLPATSTRDITDQPGVVQITLPPASQLRLWNNLEPLDAGTGDFPPALEDTTLADRLITWIRVRAPAGVHAHLWWAGINTVPISQQAIIAAEPLPDGTGEPDQVVVLARSPVVPGSVRLMVTTHADPDDWKEIEDLYAAGPEVSVPDPRSPPSSRPRQDRPVNAFRLDPEAGRLYFGDGTRGRRPAAGATLRADYAYSQGGAGNVAAGAINASPALPAGLKVSNPVATWGGTDKETVAEGEKQITRYLQHRDRLVTAVDFETITWRTPGVELGRVEVLPAYSPELPASAPGDAAGAVTVMVIPRSDPVTPRAPRPDRLFLDAIGNYLETRRLVTTEVFLCGPVYKPIWISASVQVLSGLSIAEVCLAVEKALLDFLSPMPVPPAGVPEPAAAGETAGRERGWPLRTPVVDRELWAVASRVPGVQFVRDVFIAESALPQAPVISLSGLELVEVAGISVVGNGDPISLDALRGQPQPAPADEEGARFVPVPVLLEECR